MELAQATIAALGVGITALGACVKYWVSGVDKKIDQLLDKQTSCREELPEKYIMKKDCEKEMARLEHNIIEIKGKSNGKALHHVFTE